MSVFTIGYLALSGIAERATVESHKDGAALLLHQGEVQIAASGAPHTRETVHEVVHAVEYAHGPLNLDVWDRNGRLLGAPPLPVRPEPEVARRVRREGGDEVVWSFDGPTRTLQGARALSNRMRCRSCHDGAGPTLGALTLQVDLEQPIRRATSVLRGALAVAVAAWVLLAGLMFGVRDSVIGHPVRRMTKSIEAAAGTRTAPAGSSDLEALANRVNATIWNLVEQQKQSERSLGDSFARAQQLALLGEMAASLAHEIRNPLAGVAAALEAMKKEEPSDDRREVMGQMLGELERVARTMEGFLRLSRPATPLLISADLAHIAENVTALYRPRLNAKGIVLKLEAAPIPPLQLDPNLVTQLLLNLLSNAAQALGERGTITVTIEPVSGGFARLVVADDGPGIPPEVLPRVFDPFFTTGEQGTGLGLSICKQIAEQHGGAVEIQSARGAGTRVVVSFPATAPATDARWP